MKLFQITVGMLTASLLYTDSVSADPVRTTPENTMRFSAEGAKPILENWRDGKGWAFAETKTESGGRRFVRYRILVGVEGLLSVEGKSQVLLKVSPASEWIPLDSMQLPRLAGTARSLLHEIQMELKQSRSSVTPSEAAALAGTLPALVRTIEPTVKGPNPLPPRVLPAERSR